MQSHIRKIGMDGWPQKTFDKHGYKIMWMITTFNRIEALETKREIGQRERPDTKFQVVAMLLAGFSILLLMI